MPEKEKKSVQSMLHRRVETNKDRARGLSRLLMFALLDASELDCPDAASYIADAIKEIKQEYGLSDVDILSVENSASN